jgi:hypothetical protein
MAADLRTQDIGDVYTGPGGQSCVGTIGRDVIFSNTVDPRGELHFATTLCHRADLIVLCSGSRQIDRRLPQRTLPHRPRCQPREPDYCQRLSCSRHLRMDQGGSKLPAMAGGDKTILVDLRQSRQGKDYALSLPRGRAEAETIGHVLLLHQRGRKPKQCYGCTAQSSLADHKDSSGPRPTFPRPPWSSRI